MGIEKKYIEKLNESYRDVKERNEDSISKLEYLCDYIFDFDTYDTEIGELFSLRMLEVLEAILERKTFEYIEKKDNYLNYLTMVNMSFLKDKLEWGCSIRGAWFDGYFKTWKILEIGEIKEEENEEFIKQLIEWSK